VTLRASTTGSDVTFRWYTSVAATSWLKETDGEYTTPVLVLTTPYYVSAVLPTGCESERVRVQAVIAPIPELAISVSGPVELGVRDSVVLSAPEGYVSYRWSTGAMVRSIVVRNAGSYSVTVTDSAGCSGTSPAVTITERVQPGVPRITVGGPTEFCAGDSVLLTVTPGAAYEWHRDGVPVGSARQVAASVSGTYWCLVQDTLSTEWRSSDTIQVTVHAPMLPQVRLLSRDTLLCENGVAWQWFIDGSPIPGATSRLWITARGGWYSVEVTDSNGCTARSQEIKITLVDVAMADAAGTIVLGASYPNPFTSSTQIPVQLDRSRALEIDICDQRGAVVRRIASGALPAGRHVYSWDGRDGHGQALSSGRYYIQLTSSGTLHRKPIMLLR
jgi:hypothetical protein